MQAVIYKSGLNNVRAGRVCNWGGTWCYTGADLKKESYSIMNLKRTQGAHISRNKKMHKFACADCVSL